MTKYPAPTYLFAMLTLSTLVSMPTQSLQEPSSLTIPRSHGGVEIDGLWSTKAEWTDASEMTISDEKLAAYVRAKHDQVFVYVLIDFLSDHGLEASGDFAVICFDTQNNGGNMPLLDDYCFYRITRTGDFIDGIIQGNGNEWIVLQEAETWDPYDEKFDAAMSSSHMNDPYDSVNTHVIYEFRVPIETYGLNEQMGLYVYVNDAYTKDFIEWPTDAGGKDFKLIVKDIVPAPDQWGQVTLEISDESSADKVVINEVELNPRGIDSYTSVTEWIELYNSSDSIVDVGGWSVSSSALSTRSSTIRIPEGIVVPAKGYLLVYSGSLWLNDFDETVSLLDSHKKIMNQAGPFDDDYNDGGSWQTVPDGSNNWIFKWNTKQVSNSITDAIVASNLGIVDQAGIPKAELPADQETFFEFDLRNDTRELLELVYMVQIKDSNGFTEALLSSTLLLAAQQEFTAVQSWTPKQIGCYAVEIFIWQSMNNPIILSQGHLGSSLCVVG
jgi:hypothetical protein